MDSLTTVEVLNGKLGFSVLKKWPGNADTTNQHFFHTSDLFNVLYVPFSSDFGPPCTASIYHFCKYIDTKLKGDEYICFYVLEKDRVNLTNGVLLMGAYCILTLGWTAQKTLELFAPVEDLLLHYRDASEGESTYGLEMKWCFTSLEKAYKLRWIDLEHFDYEEYTHYEQVENGDFNWIIPGKLLAFCSPADPVTETTHSPKYYAKYFKEHGINAVVRLNSTMYNAKDFVKEGIAHYDLQYSDGTTPPLEFVEKFLEIAETSNGVAVHCKQGLGRTGTLNACYMMKHYNFNAAECIAFQRIQRPGSVVGVQQHYLHKLEPKLKAAKLGLPISPPRKTGTPVRPSPKHCGQSAQREKLMPAVIPIKTKKTPIKQSA